MKISTKILKAITISVAIAGGIFQEVRAQAVVRTGSTTPVCPVRAVETSVGADTVYSPIGNDVVNRLPLGTEVVANVDTLKLQVMTGINSGIISGKLTESEAERLYAMMDDVALQEAQFKLGCWNYQSIANIMRKYHMVDQYLDVLSSNTATNDFMPNIENRRNMLSRRILWHMASANITPAEGEQLLMALNNVSDLYATYRATGGVLTADELEAVHKDLLTVHNKLRDRLCRKVAVVCPPTYMERSEYLKRIQEGLAYKTLSLKEGARLMTQYNRLVLLEQSIASTKGLGSPDMRQLAAEIDNLNFILTRDLRDRSIAGSYTRF